MMEIIPSIMFVTELRNELINDNDALRVRPIGVTPNDPKELLSKGVFILV